MLGSCKYSPEPVRVQSLSLTFHNLPASRAGEVYALWCDVPKGTVAPIKGMHEGASVSKLVGTFRVVDTSVFGLDLSKAKANIGVDFTLISDAELSVENPDSITDEPKAIYLVGSPIVGTTTYGTTTMRADVEEVFGTDQSTIIANATLASAAKTAANYKGEVYLMNANDPTNTSKSLAPDPLPFLPGTWQYGMWTIDSSATPPVNTFLGYIRGVKAKDSKSAKDNFNYPGGRSPNDVSPVLDLTTGMGRVLVSLEPAVLQTDPVTPFHQPVLWGTVPQGQAAFTPFGLQNVSGVYPTIDVKIYR